MKILGIVFEPQAPTATIKDLRETPHFKPATFDNMVEAWEVYWNMVDVEARRHFAAELEKHDRDPVTGKEIITERSDTMPHYRTCPDCGSHLDPSERCDCQGPGEEIAALLAGEKEEKEQAHCPPIQR